MTGHVYALLVGIDRYPDKAHQLDGCLNDIAAFSELLTMRVAPEGLRLLTLLDEQATRDHVIGAFKEHLGHATDADTVLFYYAGHGSRERAPEEFWTIEPDRLDETLVLWDSREAGGWDLADKELAALIRPIATAGAHVLVILDSCHSGSGTRAVDRNQKVRRFPIDVRERPLASFLPEVQRVSAAKASDSGWDLGDDGRHVLLAACADDQEAAERSTAGTKRGAFSFYLDEVLRQAPGMLTYRDLAESVRARVVAAVANQDPQAEATVDADLDRPFLGGVIQPRGGAFYASEQDGEWWIDGGAIHGVPMPSGAEAARVALFAVVGGGQAGVTTETLATAIALADIVDVQPARSRLAFTRGALETGVAYKAVVVSTPLALRTVRLDGDAASVSAMRAALAGSLYVSEGNALADFVVHCSAAEFRVHRAEDGLELVAPANAADIAVRTLEQIIRWRHFAELANPVSGIDPSEFEVKILAGQVGDTELDGSNITLTATRSANGLVAPPFRVRFENRSERDLYFGILALDELYACTPDLVKGGVKKLQPGDAPGWALDGRALKSAVAAALRREGRTQSRDILKLIVSTVPFNISLAALPALGPPRRAREAATSPAGQAPVANTLERLLARGVRRTISAASDTDDIGDFQVQTIFVTVVEPSAGAEITSAATANAGAGVLVEAHAALRGRVRLTSVAQTRSDAGVPLLPPLLRADSASETIPFTSGRGASPPLSVLEICDVADHSVVTADAPLRITLPERMGDDDVILPIAHDGEDYLILGSAAGRAGGGTTVTLSRLPHPVRSGSRSLGGSIRIVFQKFTAPFTGAAYEYPLLALARWDAGGAVKYDLDHARISAKVAVATRVVVMVHGIIGDTRAMGAKLVPRAGDVFLTFDYENLNTTIEANAAGLRDRLATVGLGPGHGKELVIVAHSMGGLVSRWFVEQLGGREIVDRVILCGTPNAGSNWSTLEDWLTSAASLALNGLSKISWEAATVGALFRGFRKCDRTLAQMNPASDFLHALAALDDPGIGYVVLAGNTSLAADADAPRVKRLLRKVLYDATSIAFLFKPNDLAASVASITGFGARWHSPPDARAVGCDHMSYFSHPEGVDALRKELG